ncbi:hypothetical protein KCH_65960 [Kitasatospora cheerisanensis KCTC 2395]|uniref:Uncharacterized protein n=1 Tax=Kitasatospora cheerisanensis KCTC 2395 TaxID=1348663 RepID=A0A066YNT7_9ACTN|nr:hypothetical protein KCH_65960 [Kitasatospora cheerisanensis KCTC 2395]
MRDAHAGQPQRAFADPVVPGVGGVVVGAPVRFRGAVQPVQGLAQVRWAGRSSASSRARPPAAAAPASTAQGEIIGPP